MKIDYQDFIGVYTDVYPEGYCEHLISEFEKLTLNGAGYDRQRGEGAPRHVKNDHSINMNSIGVEPFNNNDTPTMFFTGLQKCFDEYVSQYSILADQNLSSNYMKMQRTSPGGGYHVWHAEHGRGESSNRVLVYILYLNTLSSEDAGETEFLYQKKRFSPQKNKMVIWPAAYTHTHRGNPVLGDQYKYIITGWFYVS
jgi:hypothetical protein